MRLFESFMGTMQMFIIIIDNELNNYLTIKGIIGNMFRPQIT